MMEKAEYLSIGNIDFSIVGDSLKYSGPQLYFNLFFIQNKLNFQNKRARDMTLPEL